MRNLKLICFRSGSTVVEHEIVTNKTQDSDIQQVELVSKLLGQQNIEYDGINLTTSQIAITDTSGKTVGKFELIEDKLILQAPWYFYILINNVIEKSELIAMK